MPFLRARSPKHAAPSKAAPMLVAGGMATAFVVADLAATTGAASASAPNSEWDRLAQCEAGGNWSINTGNGYYGGLQFNLSTWRSVGGSGRPDQASRSEQIRRGNLLHDSRGWSPWPSCSRKLGLRSGPATPAAEPSSRDESAQATEGTGASRSVEATRASRSSEATRASRSRRAAVQARAVAAPRITGKYQASRRARVVVALATTTPPTFDGHVLSANDAGTYRIAAKHWQRRMAARGWDIQVDGHFGPQSAVVAQRFAAQKQLTPAVPGTVDKDVWAAAWSLAVS
ncbi:MAG: Transglycosylase domain protein [Frankiales bacterium]|nr:Transglycosylase domain protein [Frankiales bacterium]